MSDTVNSELIERAGKINRELSRVYPDAKCALLFSNPFQLLVATVLSARCTDKAVNKITPGLFNKYKTPDDIANAPIEQFEAEIKTLGMYKTKARNIQAMCRDLVNIHNSRVPDSMDALTALRGVGRKTANVVLGNAFGKNAGIVVDTHVERLSKRLGLAIANSAEKIEKELIRLIPQNEWTMFSHRLILHGRNRCFSRNPDCDHCEINSLCPSTKTTAELQA
ncbi:MAG: endonuclease III [Verrucomicrobia bacterium]|nr:endonuclease III [Verrucomicrobiota bacterium]MCF7708941.1 endonuclease III [Verrucomicrobiota bacterium]